ncbi:tartronate semialdehyde reductase [Variovorax sp. PBS-H4]|uniref:NAD-binding protein n=1 Tax=Variovorax sp. PBS-H4 TaxID=434008 RepID=UPI0013161405|nr:NAD-binding protein [Variovorax sp. PBS-H4]VTU37423.1 tartronate semialdehyde reductase [Variovorax sp. PBS-H4]
MISMYVTYAGNADTPFDREHWIDVSAANAAKIACNMMIAITIEAMAEAVVLTEVNGVPRESFFELILGTVFDSRLYRTYSSNISAGAYEPGFWTSASMGHLRPGNVGRRGLGTNPRPSTPTPVWALRFEAASQRPTLMAPEAKRLIPNEKGRPVDENGRPWTFCWSCETDPKMPRTGHECWVGSIR